MKRIRYFDLLRCISFCFIIFYHMISQLYFSKLFPLDKILPFYENDNMNIAMLGVAVFFILSGAGLAYSTAENFDIRRFYKKRFIRVLIPFYITYISYFIYKVITTSSFTSFFPPETSSWKIIFTFFGMDEWISQHGIHTFSLGIGEWFLGALLLLYLLFPLLRFLMKKNSRLFFVGSTCIYLLLLFYYPFSTPVHVNLLIKGYDFILGMLLGYTKHTFRPQWAFLSVPLVIFFFVSPFRLGIHYELKVEILAVAFCISFSYLEPLLQKKNLKLLDLLSNYSYEIFLVHHIVIYVLTPASIPYLRGSWSVSILFAAELVFIAFFAFILKWLSGRCIAFLSRRSVNSNVK